MFKELYLKDLYYCFADKRMMIAGAVIFLMMLIVGVAFIGSYQQNMSTYQENVINNQNNIRVDSKNFALKSLLTSVSDQPMEEENTLHDLTFLEQKILKNPASLSFISEAEENLLPNGVTVGYFGISNPEFFKARNVLNTSISIDWRSVFIWLVSLVCICFAYNAFSGERAQGTLKLQLSNSVHRSSIILSKLLSIVTVVCIPIIAGIVFDLLIINLFSKAITIGWYEITLCLIFICFSILFILFNILFCFLISLCVKDVSSSLSICLLLWVAFSIIVPNTGWMAAKKLSPVPSMVLLYDEENRQKEALNKEYSRNWNSNWAGRPPHEEIYERKEWSDHMDRIHHTIWGNYQKTLFYQTDQAILVSKISPFSVFRFASEGIADNGYTGYKNFYSQAHNYSLAFQNFIKEKDMQDKDSYHLIWNEIISTRTFMSNRSVSYNEVPQFEYVSPTVSNILIDIMGGIIYLILLNILLFAFDFMLFIKYDVR